MSTTRKVTLYLATLVCVFVAMFFAGRALVPEEAVQNWTNEATRSSEHEGHGSEHPKK